MGFSLGEIILPLPPPALLPLTPSPSPSLSPSPLLLPPSLIYYF